ncbi:hypothetical protein [Vibrio barjaei]|uniref:Uncharacterized protein n=1 Tax=Vibrio barjaei TaxID=1676683 RepID=A0ABW7IF41_9VIBR|nr:hypothetical protein [Vibrio barjaei]MCY9871306.1 hypothetical protein [Vibrio barjaei]
MKNKLSKIGSSLGVLSSSDNKDCFLAWIAVHISRFHYWAFSLKRLIELFPLIATLLSILLLGGIVNAMEVDLPQYQATVISPDRTPDLANDNQLLRSSTFRVPIPKAQSASKEVMPWLLVVAAFTCLITTCWGARYTPRSYLFSDSRRLAGWQDSNLQYRFIHSR